MIATSSLYFFLIFPQPIVTPTIPLPRAGYIGVRTSFHACTSCPSNNLLPSSDPCSFPTAKKEHDLGFHDLSFDIGFCTPPLPLRKSTIQGFEISPLIQGFVRLHISPLKFDLGFCTLPTISSKIKDVVIHSADR